jgi:hypothetical protein
MTNWANRSKQSIQEVELKPINGGAEPISAYYNYTPRKDGTLGENSKLFTKGEVIRGNYEGSFKTEAKTGKSKGQMFTTHKIRTTEGKLVGLSGSGLLNYLLGTKNGGIPVGTLVEVIYDGRDDQDRHQFIVKA